MSPGPELHELAVRLSELSHRTARQVLAVLEQVAAGVVELDALPELVAILTELGATQAAALTSSELAAELSAAAGRPVVLREPVVNLQPAAVQTAAATILAGPAEQHGDRLARLARSAVARAGQDARADGIRRSGLVEGWTRGVDSTSCQLCVWWWRGGRVWPKSHHMPRHPGCTCVQVPKLVRELVGVSREAQDDSAERRELDRAGRYLAAFGTDRRHKTSQ